MSAVRALLTRGEITYELLPFLFRPSEEIYAVCAGTSAPRCFKYIHGEEEVELNGSAFFCVEGRFLDFDGTAIGEAIGKIKIEKFRGPKQVRLLSVYSFRFHPEAASVKEKLALCGRTFLSLRGIHYRDYDGDAFRFDNKGNQRVFNAKGRVMIDVVGFHDANSKYHRRRVSNKRPSPLDIFGSSHLDESSQIKHMEIDADHLDDDELILFNSAVMGFSMKTRMWCKLS